MSYPIRDIVLDLMKLDNDMHSENCGFKCRCRLAFQNDLNDKYNPLLEQHGEERVQIPDNFYT